MSESINYSKPSLFSFQPTVGEMTPPIFSYSRDGQLSTSLLTVLLTALGILRLSLLVPQDIINVSFPLVRGLFTHLFFYFFCSEHNFGLASVLIILIVFPFAVDTW